MNSEDFKCNTCGDVADFAYRLCRLCAPDRTDVGVKRTMRKYFLKHATEDVSVTYSGAEVKDLDDLLSSWEGEIDYVHVPVKTSPVKAHEPFAPRHMQYAVEIVKPRVFDPPMKIKIVKAILSKQTPPK